LTASCKGRPQSGGRCGVDAPLFRPPTGGQDAAYPLLAALLQLARDHAAAESTGTTFSDTGYQASWEVSRAQAGNSGILVDYTGGNATVDGYASQPSPYTRGNDATTAKLGQKALAMMEPVYPGLTKQANGKAVLSIPPKDTDFNCSYSYLRVGQYTAFSGHEKAAQGHCFFAGEHCSQDYQGFVEGAAQEGQRAANEIAAAWAIV